MVYWDVTPSWVLGPGRMVGWCIDNRNVTIYVLREYFLACNVPFKGTN